MKTHRITLAALLCAISSFTLLGQNDYPQQDEDYKSSWEEDYRGDDYITYTYYLGNIGNESIIFYNFNISPDSDRYEILQSYPEDVLILNPNQKSSYLQVKVYTNGPALTWNSKFMRVKDESSIYPQQNRDYVYYWKLISGLNDNKAYTYHLKNISEKTIKFYNFTLTDNGGEYDIIDHLLQKPAYTEPGESIQLVKYNYNSGETPSVNWYADWTSFTRSSDAFCSGLIKILEASKDEAFSSIKGEIKEEANDTDTFFDSYYCKEHIDGIMNEAIEDIIFFYQYKGTIGTPGTQEIIHSRFYDYKSKIESCLPDFPEKKTDEEEDSGLFKVEYEAEVDYYIHFIRLEEVYDYISGNYSLDLVVEEAY